MIVNGKRVLFAPAGTKVKVNGVTQGEWNADTKANQTSLDETNTNITDLQNVKAEVDASNLTSENVESWRNKLFEKIYDVQLETDFYEISVPIPEMKDGDILHVIFNGKMTRSTDVFLQIGVDSGYTFSGWASGEGSPVYDGSENINYFKIGVNGDVGQFMFSDIKLQKMPDRISFNCLAGGNGITGLQAMRLFVGYNATTNVINSIRIFCYSGNIAQGTRLQIYKEFGD